MTFEGRETTKRGQYTGDTCSAFDLASLESKNKHQRPLSKSREEGKPLIFVVSPVVSLDSEGGTLHSRSLGALFLNISWNFLFVICAHVLSFPSLCRRVPMEDGRSIRRARTGNNELNRTVWTRRPSKEVRDKLPAHISVLRMGTLKGLVARAETQKQRTVFRGGWRPIF